MVLFDPNGEEGILQVKEKKSYRGTIKENPPELLLGG